jgi:Beta-propeller repeat
MVALAARPPVSPPASEGTSAAAVLDLPLAFEPNAGRTGGDVEFVAHQVAGGTLYLRPHEAVLQLPQPEGGSLGLRLGFGSRGVAPEPRALEPLPGKANSFVGDDPSRWRTGLPMYGRVRYASVQPGIDLDFYGDQRRLEYDFRLAAGADPSRIAVELGNADSARISAAGELVIRVGGATVRQPVPVAYQRVAGKRQRVPVAYTVEGSTLGFKLGAHDRSRPLVIDPLVLSYSTYLGGGMGDFANGIDVDGSGAAYITGETTSTDFPTQDPRDTDLPQTDVFVTKIAPDTGGAATLAYSTYLGGDGLDVGHGIFVDAAGRAYVTGATGSTNFPTQLQYQGDQGSLDTFVTALTPDSGGVVTLSYSSYLGGSGADGGNGGGIAVDAAGAVYVSGETFSSNFPTVNPFQGDQGDADVFVTKLFLPLLGNLAPAYSTYLGGGAIDLARWDSLAVDAAGAAYVTGQTESSNFPTQDPLQTDQTGTDAFVTKLNPDSGGPVTLAYSTYLGGGAFDQSLGIAVDSSGAAHVAGSTGSTNFPTADPIQGDQASADGFVARLSPDSGGPVTLAYSTYLGGGGDDGAQGLALDGAGAVYVAGSTSSTDFPAVDPLTGAGPGGNGDAFAAKLSPDSGGPPAFVYSTTFGGEESEVATDVAVDAAGSAYVAGTTFSTGFPTVDPFQADQGANDAFVAKLDYEPPVVPDTDPPETTIVKGPKRKTKKRKARFTLSSNEPGATFECKLDKRAFRPCEAAFKLKVKRRKHTLLARATDPAGNVDPTPAKRKWKVKRKR